MPTQTGGLDAAAVENTRKTLTVAEEARRQIRARLESAKTPETAPGWFEDYARSWPLDGRTAQDLWDLRHVAADRDHDAELWWMLCFLGSGQYLKVPSGFLQGQPFQLLEWQREFITAAYREDCVEATLSTARKNGKTGLICSLAAYYLSRVGWRRGWRGLCISLTGIQAMQLRDDLHELLSISGIYETPVPETGAKAVQMIRTRPGLFRVPHLSIEFKLMASNVKASGVGSSADLVVIDELGAFEDKARPLIRNIETSTSARAGRSLAISVEGVSNSFMIERERRYEQAPDRYHYRRYAAAEGCSLDDEDQWFAANPSLGKIKSLAYMRSESLKAILNPVDQASFRNLELNQRSSPVADSLCTPDDWLKIETADLPPREGPMMLGVDLGGVRSFSSAVALWPVTGRLEAVLAVGGIPNLRERGRYDGVGLRYETMRDEGTLIVIEGDELVPHRTFIELVEQRFGIPDFAAADYYRGLEIHAAMRAAGCPWGIELRRCGPGLQGGADIRAFQKWVISGRLRVRPGVSWPSAISETMVKFAETTQHPSLAKRRGCARIDLIQAGVIAVGLADRWAEEQEAIRATAGQPNVVALDL